MRILDEIAAERRRQIAKGYDAFHDDQHIDGELARAAACYAAHQGGEMPEAWPFEAEAWAPEDMRANRIKAAALLVAEVERIDRVGIRDEIDDILETLLGPDLARAWWERPRSSATCHPRLHGASLRAAWNAGCHDDVLAVARKLCVRTTT